MKIGSGKRHGSVGWVLQRVSAVLLLVLIVAHLWIEHFMHLGRPITYSGVVDRLMHGIYDAVDYGLLIVVVYHGLNGLRNVLMDRVTSAQGVAILNGTLGVVGVATVILGADILSAFLDGRAWFYL